MTMHSTCVRVKVFCVCMYVLPYDVHVCLFVNGPQLRFVMYKIVLIRCKRAFYLKATRKAMEVREGDSGQSFMDL